MNKEAVGNNTLVGHLKSAVHAAQRVAFAKGEIIFSQGDKADSLFCIDEGQIKISVVSRHGKEAAIGLIREGSFFGEACIIGQPRRTATASALTDTVLLRFDKPILMDLLNRNSDFTSEFISHLVEKTARMEEDIVDHIFNSSEKRLARLLLILANYGKDARPQPISPRINQETLAEMIGTTRSRVSQFMSKFRKLGYIEYDEEIRVHNSLVSVLMQEPDD